MNQLKSATLEMLVEKLYARINYEGKNRPRPGDFKLANMQRFLKELGDPHLACPVIHVAGTKGKGSVSSMIRTILSECQPTGKDRESLRIGSYTSPHLDRINQRISVSGQNGCQNISDEDLRRTLLEIWPVVDRFDQAADASTEKKLTFFEIITTAGFVFFANQKLDAVVLEVGMGGRLDSTNVCQPILTVITSISFDHTKQLGSTLDLIAREKAGIAKPGVPLISGVSKVEPATAIHEIAAKNSSPVFELGRDFEFEKKADRFSVKVNLPDGPKSFENLKSNLAGTHQINNASVAVAACAVLNALHDGDIEGEHLAWKVPPEAIVNGLSKVTLPGRAELIAERPAILLDIAHNPASMEALAETLKNYIPAFTNDKKRHLVFAASREKDVANMLAPILPLFDEIWLTKYIENPRSMPLDQLCQVAKKFSGDVDNDVNIAENPRETWAQIESTLSADDFVCICGSAFLVAELRPTLMSWVANNR